MEDFFDNFDDDFDEMDEDSFEDSLEENFEMDDTLDDDSEIEGETAGDDIHDADFTAQDAFFLGSAMGWAYEEGLEERKRRKLEKEMNDKTDKKEDD